MQKKLDSGAMKAIRANVRDAFAYLKAHKGRDSVIFEGETYFDEKTLVRAIERSYQQGRYSLVSVKHGKSRPFL